MGDAQKEAALRLGFVGCGTHSTNNLYPALAYAHCRLEAVCDQDAALAQRNADVFHARRLFTDAQRMLDECALDGVMVVGPPALHYEVGKLVLGRGLPLFTEKPPAPSLAEAEEMASLARLNGTFHMTGFMKRHGLAYRRLREMIGSGALAPAALRINYSHWPMADLRQMLLFMSSHPIDLAISCFGHPASVTPILHVSERGALALGVTLRFPCGRWAQLMLDSHQPRVQERLEMSGTMDGGNALVVVDNVQHMEVHRATHNGTDLDHDLTRIEPNVHLEGIQMWRPDFGIPNMQQSRLFFQGFVGEVREFVAAIRERRAPDPGMDDALAVMRVIEAILRKPSGVTEM